MNSSTNPRKFAEKIAKLHQKEVEQTMAFEQIMAEVIVATRVNTNSTNSSVSNPVPGPSPGRPMSVLHNQVRSSDHHLHINQSVANCRAESLPNVNYIGSNSSMCQNSIDLQSALNNLEEMRRGTSPGKDRPRHASPGRSGQVMQGSHRRSDITSPYATPYLSPPDPWRRTNSDSALHHSSLLPSSPSTSRRSPVHVGSLHGLDSCQNSSAWDPGKNRHYILSQQDQNLLSPSEHANIRPKSCEVPNITVNLTQDEPGVHHVPIAGNTGSLPDLTSFHFPAPLSTPLDADDPLSISASNSQSSQYQTQSNSNCGSPFSAQHPCSMTYSPPPDMLNHQPMNRRNNLAGDPLDGAGLLVDSDLLHGSGGVPVIEIYPSQEESTNCITTSLTDSSNFHFPQSNCGSGEVGCDPQRQQQQSQQQQPQDVTSNGHWSQYQASPASPFLGAPTDSPYSNCGSPFSPQSSCSAVAYSPPPPDGSNADTATTNSQNFQADEASFRRINLYEDELELHEDSTCEVN